MGIIHHVPQDWDTRHARFVERSVHGRKDRVAETNRISNVALDGLFEEVGFATFRVDVTVSAEEGREGTDLVPPDHHLGRGVAKESSNIGWESLCQSTGRTVRVARCSPPENVIPAIPFVRSMGTVLAR